MDIFSVVALGFIAGWLASQIMDTGVYRRVGGTVAGILGAYAGAWLAAQLLGATAPLLSAVSVIAALVGALTVIVLFSLLGPGRQTLGQIFLGR
ncbi:MAG: GlsB/YeaQ/YmgE family stress response membrane protein [Chloroflexota bacterium]